ncbi:MAG: hypothetical protein U9Q63_01185 [Patescibacteria group bacterium]|nr:hypothetical protein [Patescibacteria group bacterium]
MSAVVRLESLKTFKAEPPSLEELARLMPKKIDFSGIVKDHVGASFLEFQMNPGEYLKKRWSLRIDGKWNKRASRNYLLALYLLSVAGGLLACLNLPQNSNNPDVPINTDPDGDDNQVIGNLCLALETAGAHFAADFSQYADSYLVFNTGDVHSGDLSNLQEQATCFLSGENHSTHVDVTSFLGGLGETPNTLSIIQTFADEHGEIGVNPLWAVSVPDGDPDDNFETFSLFSADKNVAEIDEHGGKVRMRLLPVSVGVDGDISVLEDKEPIFLEKADDFESNYTLTAGDSNPVMLSVKGHGSLSGLGLLSENIERAQEGLDKLKESSVIFGKNPEISAVVGIEPGQADGVKFLENSWEIQDGLNDQGFAPVIVETDDGNILNVTNGSCIPGLPGQLWNPNAVEGKDEFLSLNDLGFTLYGGSDGVRYKAITDLGIDVDNCVNLVVTNSQDLPYGMNFKAGTLVTALINPENGEVLSVIPIVYDMSDDVVITRDELGVTITATDENGIQNIYTLDLSMGVDINITPEVPEEIGEFCQISGCEAELNEEGNYE